MGFFSLHDPAADEDMDGGKDKDGKESHKRKLAVISVVSSSASTEENVMCLLHYTVGYLNDAKA